MCKFNIELFIIGTDLPLKLFISDINLSSNFLLVIQIYYRKYNLIIKNQYSYIFVSLIIVKLYLYHLILLDDIFITSTIARDIFLNLLEYNNYTKGYCVKG